MNQALGTDVLERALAERTGNSTFFEAEAERLARLCHGWRSASPAAAA